MKEKVAQALADRVKDGDVIGIGSGSTVELALKKIGERIANEGLSVAGVPTSYRSATVASEQGILVLSPFVTSRLVWAFDGADEVDPKHDLIKGAGAAMLYEKIVASKADEYVIIVGEDKLVDKLGEKFSVPIEIIPCALSFVESELQELGAISFETRVGSGKYGPITTDAGNIIIDAKFDVIDEDLESDIKSITGVVESGLFMGFCPEVLVATSNEVISRIIDEDGEVVERKIS